MGMGDEIMASGMARGASERGECIAFGDGRRIIWSPNSAIVFANNPNVAWPGQEVRGNVRWVNYYPTHRIYSELSKDSRYWVWNYSFKAPRGEIYLTDAERAGAVSLPDKYVLVEPNVLSQKVWTQNKMWPHYQALVDRLGVEVVQFVYGGSTKVRLKGARIVETQSRRQALTYISRAGLYVGPEGGMQHAAAAFNVPSVILWGGWSPPGVMGYEDHVNLTGSPEACGSNFRCGHCEKAMQAITVDQVYDAAVRRLQ